MQYILSFLLVSNILFFFIFVDYFDEIFSNQKLLELVTSGQIKVKCYDGREVVGRCIVTHPYHIYEEKKKRPLRLAAASAHHKF